MAGKWKVAELTPTRVDTPDGSISVSWVNNFDGGVRERKAEAVARLIAAAPDYAAWAESILARGTHRGTLLLEIEDVIALQAIHARATQPLPAAPRHEPGEG